jgi:hypothetical protein
MAKDDEESEERGIPWETVSARFGFDDVGRRALRGVARESILADYPALLDEDIEQARRFIETQEQLFRDRGNRPPFDVARFQRRRRPLVVSEFDVWVAENNIPDHFEFGKGWWDYVELIRMFAFRLDTEDMRVVGHYIVETPHPTELLPMPAVAIVTPGATFAFRYDFGTWSLKQPVALSEWVLSVDLAAPYRGPTFGLFDETRDLRPEELDGLSPNYLFGPYRQDQARFSCVVKDQWDVATLLRILSWRA